MSDVDHTRDVCDRCEVVISTLEPHACPVPDSVALRLEFDQPDIVDGWEILAEGDGGGAYGYGSRDLLMYLRGPDGKLYCQEASCCSCNGIEGSFDPVETNIETVERDLEGYVTRLPDYEKAEVCRQTLRKLGVEPKS